MKTFHLIGISYKSADAQMLGKCSIKNEKKELADKLFSMENLEEFAVLSTCNRCEIYFVDEDEKGVEKVWKVLEKIFEEDFEYFKNNAYAISKKEAIVHMFSLASGLESEMTGETEILGQLKSAYKDYQEKGYCKTILNQVFQKAIHVGKWIRTNTQVGKGKITIGSVSAELATRIFDDLKESKILLLGTGQVGKSVAQSLSVRGVGLMAVSSRTWQKALDLSLEVKSLAIAYDMALEQIHNWDIVICALALEKEVLTKRIVSLAMEKRGMSPMFIIDLGMPKNVEEKCSQIEGVFLYNLADLSRISNENMEGLNSEIEFANQEIKDRSESFFNKLFAL